MAEPGSRPADPGPLRIPRVPDHQLLRRIGQGAYGDVWLARTIVGSCRAIKILHRDRFEDSVPFEREFTGICRFEPLSRNHENLIDILQIGRDDNAGYFYYVMELGDDLQSGQVIDPPSYTPKTLQEELARRGRLSADECIELGIGLARALERLHNRGLIHRDIKPSNIIYVEGVPKLADIGLVTQALRVTSAVGTEGYIPPEGPGTMAADIFSLGKVLYGAAMGKDPREFPDPPSDLAHLSHKDKLYRLHQVILKAAHSAVVQRFHSAGELAEALEAIRSEEPETASNRWPLIAAITGGILVIGLIIFLLLR